MPKGMGRIANVIGECGSCEAAEQSAFIVIKAQVAKARSDSGRPQPQKTKDSAA